MGNGNLFPSIENENFVVNVYLLRSAPFLSGGECEYKCPLVRFFELKLRVPT